MNQLLQLGQLFALPLQSAIRGQSLALQETISFIQEFGLEKERARTFCFEVERMVEERTVDQEGIPKTQFKIQPFKVSIPLLAIVSPPSMQLKEMNVEFGVEVVEVRSEPLASAVIPSAVRGSSLASSIGLFTSLGQSNPTTMKVNMKIVRETPEGLARLGDVLTDFLSGETLSRETPSPIMLLSVERIPGIDLETANILKAKQICTIKDFISLTDTKEGVKELAKTLRVPEERIVEWREKAQPLIKDKK